MLKRSMSMVYLPAMPEEAASILRQHNDVTLGIFSTYVKTFAEQFVKDEETYLPLTHTKTGVSSTGDINIDFLPSLPAPQARSAFVALSGLGDEFSTIDDLCSSTKEGVFLESAVIPHLELYPDEMKTPLNAYVLDFFSHGSLEQLEKANGIDRSDV